MRAVLAGWALLVAGAALAQPYPDRPIRLIVPNPPGGGVDIVARSIGQPLSERLGQPVVVENRAGAGGRIGIALVAKAPPDGYTLGIGVDATMTIAPALYKDLQYDPEKDFAPVTLIATVPLVLTVNPKLPVKNVKELIAFAKSNPGKVDYSSGGTGTPPHLAGEVFNAMSGAGLNHVPYKGGPPAITAVVSGEVALMFANMLPGLPHIQSGRLRAIGMTSNRRTPVLPEVPTIAESGVPDYNVSQWYGFVAPTGTPAPVVTRLAQEIRQVIATPDVSARLKREGAEILGAAPEEFATFIHNEIAKWRKVVQQTPPPK